MASSINKEIFPEGWSQSHTDSTIFSSICSSLIEIDAIFKPSLILIPKVNEKSVLKVKKISTPLISNQISPPFIKTTKASILLSNSIQKKHEQKRIMSLESNLISSDAFPSLVDNFYTLKCIKGVETPKERKQYGCHTVDTNLTAFNIGQSFKNIKKSSLLKGLYKRPIPQEVFAEKLKFIFPPI